MSTEQNKQLVLDFYNAVSRHDFDALDTYLAPDFVDHDSGPGPLNREEVKANFRGVQQGVPDMHIQVQELLLDGDMSSAMVMMTGTQTGPLMNIPATGRPFKMKGVDLFRIQNSQIVERWGVLDMMSTLVQLGVMQPPA